MTSRRRKVWKRRSSLGGLLLLGDWLVLGLQMMCCTDQEGYVLSGQWYSFKLSLDSNCLLSKRFWYQLVLWVVDLGCMHNNQVQKIALRSLCLHSISASRLCTWVLRHPAHTLLPTPSPVRGCGHCSKGHFKVCLLKLSMSQWEEWHHWRCQLHSVTE